jgi:multicomponent Na+:H+ antiporter subunit E
MSAPFSSTLPHRTVALFALWLFLSESYTVVHMGLGLIAAFGVALLNSGGLSRSAYQVRWIRAFAYIPWLFGRILVSGIHLSYLILHPSMPIDPKVFRQSTRLTSETAVAILGNSITLTPGTVTIEASSDELVVHAMDEESTLDVTSLRLENKIAGLFTGRNTQ